MMPSILGIESDGNRFAPAVGCFRPEVGLDLRLRKAIPSSSSTPGCTAKVHFIGAIQASKKRTTPGNV